MSALSEKGRIRIDTRICPVNGCGALAGTYFGGTLLRFFIHRNRAGAVCRGHNAGSATVVRLQR